MNAKEIQAKLRGYFNGKHEYRLFNQYVYVWESDYFGMTNSGYTVEVEIKVSKSDFKADFIKPKHKWLRGYHDGKTCFFTKGIEKWVRDEALMNEFYEEGKKPYSMHVETEIRQISPIVPNKFYFACPEGLLRPQDVPAYAGLIHVDNLRVEEVKKAPFITKSKPDITDRLLDKFYYRSIHLTNENREWKNRYYDLKLELGQITHAEHQKAKHQIYWE